MKTLGVFNTVNTDLSMGRNFYMFIDDAIHQLTTVTDFNIIKQNAINDGGAVIDAHI